MCYNLIKKQLDSFTEAVCATERMASMSDRSSRETSRKRAVGNKLLGSGLALIAIFQFFSLLLWQNAIAQTVEKAPDQYVAINIGSKVVRATLANTGPLRVEGLLGWTAINDDSGMLLDFVHEGIYAIHMQGMKFPIDAVWIDASDKIRLIYENIVPDSGLNYPSMFPSRYCLELKAGFCKRYNVRSGQKISFGVWPPKR